jgi:hypothetical protein
MGEMEVNSDTENGEAEYSNESNSTEWSNTNENGWEEIQW